jgi:hypothetical protein
MNDRNKHLKSLISSFSGSKILQGVFVICLFSMIYTRTTAQSGLTIASETGKNNVSQGQYVKSTVLAEHKIGKINMETGFQVDLVNGNENNFSGYTLNSSADFIVARLPLTMKAFYILTRSSDILQESNLGASFTMRQKRFEMIFGTNLRVFTFSKQAVNDYGLEKSSIQIHEINNIIYSFSYYLKPTYDHWNAGISVTNIDQFVISQETNPFINLHGTYKLQGRVTVFAQVCYKVAGFTNLELNHFGYYIKTGLIWKIN